MSNGPDEPSQIDPRTRLIEAGWGVVDDLPLPKVFAGATTAAVAHAAGVTTGSFFHHFPHAAAFADALVLAYVEPSDPRTDTSAEAMEGIADPLHHIDLIQLMRTSLTDTWQVFSSDPTTTSRFRGQLLLSAHHRAPLSSPEGPYGSVGDVLRQGYAVREAQAVAGWEAVIALTGRVVVEPFSLKRTATALTALFEGLMIRRSIDPDAVDDEMFGDVAASLATIITGPMGARTVVEDHHIEIVSDAELSPQARSGVRRRRASRARIVDATADLFVDVGWERVTASEVAERADVSIQTVLNLFGSVRGVAAMNFAGHATELRRIAEEHAGSDPVAVLRTTLLALAERVRADPEPARALLSERLEVALHRGPSLRDLDIRLEVPLVAAIMIPLAAMDLGDTDPLGLATSLINFVLCSCIASGDPARDIVELALRLVPITALVPPLHPESRSAERT